VTSAATGPDQSTADAQLPNPSCAWTQDDVDVALEQREYFEYASGGKMTARAQEQNRQARLRHSDHLSRLDLRETTFVDDKAQFGYRASSEGEPVVTYGNDLAGR
jgi:hypothetical protein